MRVGMEKAILKHLGRIVVDNGRPNLLKIVPRLDQTLGIGDGDAVDVVHDNDVLGAIRQI